MVLLAAALFGNAAPDLGSVAGGGAAGVASAVAVGLYMLRRSDHERAEFQRALGEKRQEYMAAIAARDASLREVVAEHRGLVERVDDRWAELSRQMVAALEHVSRSMDEIRRSTEAMNLEIRAGMLGQARVLDEVRAALQQLSGRVDRIDRDDTKGRG